MRALVTGATGYVGGRLVPELLAAGVAVRVLARHPERLRDRPWHDDVEVVGGDAADPEVLARALRDIDVAYYLMHSMDRGADFETHEQLVATTFARLAREQDVARLVYLGGLGGGRADPSTSALRGLGGGRTAGGPDA
jgi:uncharacterized protein YbjT (DUF2867 family)